MGMMVFLLRQSCGEFGVVFFETWDSVVVGGYEFKVFDQLISFFGSELIDQFLE